MSLPKNLRGFYKKSEYLFSSYALLDTVRAKLMISSGCQCKEPAKHLGEL